MMHYMNSNGEKLAQAIGARVKHERRALEWTLDRLAEEAGVSRRMVVNVEQGSTNPSVGTLLRLSDALGVGLPALVESPTSTTAKLVRADQGAVLWSGKHGGTGVLVAGTEPPDVVELWHWTLQPGEACQSEAHTTGTRELLHLHSGLLSMEVDGQIHELAAGDALTFAGDVDHTYENPSNMPANFSLTVFEPGVGAEHHRNRRLND